MTRNSPLSLAVAAMMGTGLIADSVAAQAAPASPNYSSHAAGFFTGLLEGRVWILERPNSRRAGDRNTVWTHYHGPEGTVRGARTACCSSLLIATVLMSGCCTAVQIARASCASLLLPPTKGRTIFAGSSRTS